MMSSLDQRKRLLATSLSLLCSAIAGAKELDVPSKFPSIQAALNAASPGDVVRVDDGLYVERVVVTVPGVTLEGDDAVIDAEYLGHCIAVLADDVGIHGFRLINGTNGLFVDAARALVEKNEIRSANGDGIRLLGDDHVVRDNHVVAVRGHGIRCFTTNDTSVTKISMNVVELAQGAGIRAEGGRLVIQQNEIDATRDGIEANPTHTLLASKIAGNDVEHTSNAAIDVESGGAGVVIRENDVRYAGDDGIFVLGDRALVRNNDVRDCEDDGVFVDGNDVAILFNDVERCAEEGIEYQGSPGAGEIIGNDVERCLLDGIHVNASSSLVQDNEVQKCGGDGIDVVAGLDNRILGNEIERNDHEGIDNSGGSTRIEENEVEKNGQPNGVDVAGTGNGGAGTVASFVGNEFGSGGAATPQRLDHPLEDD